MNKEPPSVWKKNLFEGKYYIGKANTVKKKGLVTLSIEACRIPIALSDLTVLLLSQNGIQVRSKLTPDRFPRKFSSNNFYSW